MKQYRVTSASFVHQGETGDADAVLDPRDLAEIKKLAGLPVNEEAWGLQGAVGGNLNNVPNATEQGITSPVGSSITKTNAIRAELLDKYQPNPGSDLWFLIKFDKSELTGGNLVDKVKAYFDQHPDERPKKNS
jgi:hypothetical protein